MIDDIKYYAKGDYCYDPEIIKKIDRDAEPCWYHQDDYDKGIPFDKEFTGYVKNGKVYDICGVLRVRDQKREEKEKELRYQKYLFLRKCVLVSTEEIEKFLLTMDHLASAKGKVRKFSITLKKGYVNDTNKIGGSKRKRRFKKDNRRFLTDKEIEKIKEDIEFYKREESEYSKKLKIEDLLYDNMKRLDGNTINKLSSYSLAYGYHESVGLCNIYELRFKALKERINGIAYQEILNERRRKRKLEGKIEDSASDSEEEDKEDDTIKLKDIKVFEETYQKVLERFMEDKEDEERMTVKSKREVTNKAKFYIDENGNRIELSSKVAQVVLHH